MASPFFVIGFQRSGTTLLRMMLDSHSEIAVPLDTTGLWLRYEDRFPCDAGEPEVAAAIDALLKEERIRLWHLQAGSAEIRKRLAAFSWPAVVAAFYETYAHERGKRFWGDKDPGNMTRVHVIDRWFPGSRFVHIIRDGRDACLSQLKQSFGYSLVLPCAAAWREQVWWVRAMGSLLGPARYCEVRYEDLVAEPERELHRITAFLGVDYEPGMLLYHQRVDDSIPQEKRHLWPLIDRPPQISNVGGWKRVISPALSTCFEKRAGRLLGELGYERTTEVPSGAYLEEARQFVHAAIHAIRRRE
jgi:hypothetical protein